MWKPPQLKPGSGPILGCLGTILGLFLVLVLFLAIWLNGWVDGRPPLLAAEVAKQHSLQGPPENIPFDTELSRKFPIGTSEASLLRELKREGFVKDYGPEVYAATPRTYATAYVATWYYGLICTGHVLVAWTADSQGSITALHGNYSHECG